MSLDLKTHSGFMGEMDPEKGEKDASFTTPNEIAKMTDDITGATTVTGISEGYTGMLGRLSFWLESYGVEARGYQRVLPYEKKRQSYWSLCLIWAGAGLTISNFTIGWYGPQYFGLTFLQTSLIIWCVGALGAATSAWLAVFGKRHGLRALVNSRYTFGFYGSMVMSFLNIITEVIFGILAAILGGQALSAMSSGKLSTPVGAFLIVLVSWTISTAVYKYIAQYERLAWVLPMIVYICLYAKGASEFNNEPNPLSLDTSTSAGLALSYAAIVFAGGSGWVCVSADYYVYFPEKTADWKIFLVSFLGLWVIPSIATTCGAGYGAALFTNHDWNTAWEDGDETSAALILYVLEPLGNVRYFFLFVLAFSMMSNNVFNLYSVSISMQLFGKRTSMLPRFVYTILASVVMIVVAVVGYESLFAILSNLVAIIAYWTIIYFALVAEEHILFRRKIGYNLDAWDNANLLPKGYAAMFSFFVGAVGSVVGMSETWYIGPIGAMIGASGGDLGVELGFGFAAIVYPGLRYMELKKYGR